MTVQLPEIPYEITQFIKYNSTRYNEFVQEYDRLRASFDLATKENEIEPIRLLINDAIDYSLYKKEPMDEAENTQILYFKQIIKNAAMKRKTELKYADFNEPEAWEGTHFITGGSITRNKSISRIRRKKHTKRRRVSRRVYKKKA